MMTVKQANRWKVLCGFCRGRMSAGSFSSDMTRWTWTCYACGVSYGQEGRLERALGTPVKRWVDVPEGSMVVVRSLSWVES